jgi:hypothetical protein
MDCTTSRKPARPINVSIGLRPLDGCHSQPGDARIISRDLNDQYGSRGSLPPGALTPVSPNRVEWNITLNDWVAQGCWRPLVSPFIYIVFQLCVKAECCRIRGITVPEFRTLRRLRGCGPCRGAR